MSSIELRKALDDGFAPIEKLEQDFSRATSTELQQLANGHAVRNKRAGESDQQAMTRLFVVNPTPVARAFWKVWRAAELRDRDALIAGQLAESPLEKRATDNTSASGRWLGFLKAVKRSEPNLTESQCIDRAMENPGGRILYNQALAEDQARNAA